MSHVIAQIDWTKPEWWGAVGGIASATAALLSFVVAVAYTCVTAWLLAEARRQRRAITDPHVVVYSTPDANAKQIIMLVIENIGRATAFDVQFQSDRPIPKSAYGIEGLQGQAEFMTEGAFVTGIPALPPGGRREYSWGQFGGLRDALARKPLSIKCSCKHEGRQLSFNSVVDVESLLWVDASDRDSVSKCAEGLGKLADTFRSVTSGISTLRVLDVDLKAEHEAFIKRVKEHEAPSANAKQAGGTS